ncbi:MAG: hypothetical protein AAFR61_19475 [Bacteroidota bacterium]
MMITNKVLSLLLLLSLSGLGLFAQNYIGTHKAVLSSQGASATTEWSTNQMVCKLFPEQSKMELMAKTGAFLMGASAQNQTAFQEAFIPQANRLMQLELDLSMLGLLPGSAKEIDQITVPGQIRYNDQQVNFQATLTNIRFSPQSFDANLSLSMDFSALGLAAPEGMKDKMGDSFSLSLTKLTLPAR